MFALRVLRPSLRPACLRRRAPSQLSQLARSRSSDGAACLACPEPQFFPLSAPVQAQLNRQIGEELAASLQYTALAEHLSRVAVALAGAAAMFRANADEELEHGAVLGRWLVARGGVYVPADIRAPEAAVACSAWEALRHAVCTAIRVERQVTESLLQVHQVARRCKDAPTADFISKTMLSEQVQALYFLGQLHTKVERVKDSPCALHLLDETLHCKFEKQR